MSGTLDAGRQGSLWGLLGFPVLFLAGTNALTNPFTHNLHNDALALATCALGYWVLLRYADSRGWLWLGAMVVLPAVGFVVKQSLLVWLALFGLHLAIFDRPRSWRRVVFVVVGGGALVAAVVAAGYWLWGEPFRYWIFTVLAGSGVSVLRSFRHLITVWPYVAVGLVAGWGLLRGEGASRLAGPWLVWLLLTLTEVFSSGIAWMTNHIGPGSLLAACWLLALLHRVWASLIGRARTAARGRAWFRAAVVVAALLLLFGGLGFIRVPLPAIPQEAYRYVAEIEQQFAAGSPATTLLDVGSWVYLPHGIVMKDRGPCMGDRGYGGTGDFGGILERLHKRYYRKILIRRLHSPDFWYDHYLWPNSSGIRKALLSNYREVGKIAPGWPVTPDSPAPYLLDEISILVPK
ncbi:MAG: hypothetical protein NZM33_11750 [Bryobacteraceae bacterium]|nr:hypothetical protein [Bryobacteraceae bacterium]